MVLGPYPALMLWFLGPNSLWCSGNTALGQGHRGFLFRFPLGSDIATQVFQGLCLASGRRRL